MWLESETDYIPEEELIPSKVKPMHDQRIFIIKEAI